MHDIAGYDVRLHADMMTYLKGGDFCIRDSSRPMSCKTAMSINVSHHTIRAELRRIPYQYLCVGQEWHTPIAQALADTIVYSAKDVQWVK